ISKAAASCLLKSALYSFLRKPDWRRQRELFGLFFRCRSNYFCCGASFRKVDVAFSWVAPAKAGTHVPEEVVTGSPRRWRRGVPLAGTTDITAAGDTPPALGYADELMLTLTESPPETSSDADIFDAATIAAELEGLTEVHAGNERELRMAVSRHLRAALTRGRAEVERLLIADRHGRRCAERLCAMQDEIIRVMFEFAIKHLYPAQNPSEAERMAIVATGGYGRGVLAAGSDIDLLFLLPYKQTAWGESVAETILYCLWDMGLKVGHATRSVNECIRAAKADMTIRTALLEARYLLGDRKLYDELVARFDKEVVQGTAAEFVA